MNTELFNAIDALNKETGIPPEYMYEKIEAALTAALKRDYPNCIVKVVIDPSKKDMRLYQLKEVMENEVQNPAVEISLDEARKISARYKVGSMAEVEFKPKNFGRISAGAAKQVIIQSIREAERGMLVKEYESKRDEIISATIYKVEPGTGNIILDLGKNEATLMKSEQIPGEVLKEGMIIKVYVAEVKNQTRGPLIHLSRKNTAFVKRLFEFEVPEIQDGTIMIESIAREPGSRTKIAVYSTVDNVDPVGSCIGPKGVRIANIIKEINGEKIDVIPYSKNTVEYIAAALSPAKPVNVTMIEEKSCKVQVQNSELSLAIGKEGQNVRLAAKLTGFKIDITV